MLIHLLLNWAYLKGSEKLKKYSNNIISLTTYSMNFSYNQNQKMIVWHGAAFGKQHISPYKRVGWKSDFSS